MSDVFVTETAPLLTGSATATFDRDRVYRYKLTRTWGSSGTHATWIMLNPSTADALADDPTIRRCIAFTKAWGLDGLTVVNLFAYRATDPRELSRQPDPAGPANDEFIAGALHPWTVAVAAWGTHPVAATRSPAVLDIIREKTGAAGCLGLTKAGHPRHPLYVPNGTGLLSFGSDRDPMAIPVPSKKGA